MSEAVPLGLTVDIGWPWWAMTAIAAGVAFSAAMGLAVAPSSAVRAVAVLVVVQGIAVAVAAYFVMPSSAGSSMGAGNAAVVHVIEHQPASSVRTIGGVQVFANEVYDGGDVRRVGNAHGFCLHLVVAKDKSWECVYTTDIPGGSITIEGNYTLAAGMTPSAIIGGTGKYANAGGYMLQRTHNKASTEFDDFFHVSRGTR